MSIGTISISGLSSGLDTDSIIQALAAVQQRPLAQIKNRLQQRSADLKTYQNLAGQIAHLRAKAAALGDISTLQARTVSVSDSTALLATARPGAALGEYTIKIKALAQNHKISSAAVADPDAAFGVEGEVRLNGQVISLSPSDSLRTFAEKINHAQAGVTASLLQLSPTDYRLLLRRTVSGAQNLIELAEASGGTLLQQLGLLNGALSIKHAGDNKVASDAFSSATLPVAQALGLMHPPSGTVRINDTEVPINLGTDSLQDIAARINASVEGVTASVISLTQNGRLYYRLEIAGAATPTLLEDGGVLEALGILQQGFAHILTAAQNAEIEIEGYTITPSSNSLDEVLEGISLDLLQADPEKIITLRVQDNPQATVNALQELINSYNTVMRTLNEGLKFDAETNSGGVFCGDSQILMIQEGLQSRLLAPVATLAGALTLPAQIGLATDSNGYLTLEAAKFLAALKSNPAGVQRLLSLEAETTHPDVTFVSADNNVADSGPAGYAVYITQPATKATAQSAPLPEGLLQDELLTINDRYAIQLFAGMTLQEAADKINWILSSNNVPVQASVVDNRLQLQSTLYGCRASFSVASSLADGSGGTDLGAPQAGQAEIYFGQDVAGTINGKAAQGLGQYLTATDPSLRGLQLLIKSDTPGPKGVVKISQGFASRLAGYVAQITDPTQGLLTRAMDAISTSIAALNEQAAQLQQSVDRYVERLQLKFAALEGVVAKNKAILNYLSTQMTVWKGLNANTQG